MSTISSTIPLPTTPTSSTSGTGTNSTSTNPYALQPSDFIKLMVTQLQNQDPTQPTNSQDLLAQMSQIGQLESSTQLQTSLTAMTLQTQIGAAGNLIGKSVQGLSDANNTVKGVVNSVSVQGNQVYLNLDSGGTLQLGKVTTITNPPATPATAAAA